MEPRRTEAALLRLLVTTALSLASLQAGAAAPVRQEVVAPIFCCTDAKGQDHCSDVLPQQCYGREYREMSRSGKVLRVIPAPLTAEQRAAKEAQAAEAKRAKEEAEERRRQDSALLATYTTVEEIDLRRDRQVAELERAVALLQEREELILSKRKTLERDKEFHKDGKLPANLEKSLEANSRDLANVQDLIASKQKEVAATKERYAAERARFAELRSKR